MDILYKVNNFEIYFDKSQNYYVLKLDKEIVAYSRNLNGLLNVLVRQLAKKLNIEYEHFYN